MALPTAISTKLPSKRHKSEFYRYYAGYPVEFAVWALQQIELRDGDVVLDPWNGSGTTAAACLSLGISCHGYDINPVMVHLGRARSASDQHFIEASDLIAAVQARLSTSENILLSEIGAALREGGPTEASATSAAIAALFPFARNRMTAAKTKNPSWFRTGGELSEEPVNAGEFFDSWHRMLRELRAWRTQTPTPNAADVTIELGDSRQIIGGGARFDAVITSPPYLTRLDYVQATLPEYLLVQILDRAEDMKTLRGLMIGSPLTSDRVLDQVETLPSSIKDVLCAIKGHASKASATYYYRFFASYFVDLNVSMMNIAKALRSNADACIVVQSSHYKEIEVNLADAIMTIGERFGLHHQLTCDFDSRRSISSVNSRAHASARKPKNESAIFLRKG